MRLDKSILDQHLQDLAARLGVPPYSREFIFGSDEDCIRSRNQTLTIGPTGPVTLLDAMLRHGLDDSKRASLFFSPYHLGSSKRIPQDRLTLADLARKIRTEKHESLPTRAQRSIPLNADPDSLKKEFESITDTLKAITGRRFGDYEDKQNAIRVIYLLDRMMPDSRFSNERRECRLLTFLNTSFGKYSFEARDAHPIQKSEDNTFLLNDLKAYIGIEISNETRDRIDSTFCLLIERMDAIRCHLDKVAYSSGQRLGIQNDYRTLSAVVAAIDVSPNTVSPRKSPRLDLDLYLHMDRFEFLHFAGAHAEILDKARPPSPITPIADEMIDALSILTSGRRSYVDTTLDNFWLTGFPSFANENSGLLLDLIEQALGFRPSDAKYARSVALANELLYRIRIFGRAWALPRDQVAISFRSIVSALCATSQALRYPTRYRPRVFSDNSQPRSIVTPLETSIDLADYARAKEIQEGFLQIWHNRREWVQDALEGNHEVAELKFSLRRLLWDKVVECVRPNDIAVIEKNLSGLETRLLGVRPDGLCA